VYNAKLTIILTLASASISIGVDIGLHQYPNVTSLKILFVFSSFSTSAIVTGFLNCLHGPRLNCYSILQTIEFSTQKKSPIKLAQLSKLSYKNRIAVYTRPSSYYLLPVKQLHSKERKLFDLIFHN
jgi:hypothetical protein